MERYDHGGNRFSCENIRLDFSVSLNPLGMPPEVKEAVSSAIAEYETYPDTRCRRLCSAIAARDGVQPDDVLCGNGASELIYRLCLVTQPKTTLLLAPTFSEYERAALLYGSSIRYHYLDEYNGFALTESILKDITPEIDLFFLCNPNNPTGQLVDINLMEAIAHRCHATGTQLMVDECFLSLTEGTSCRALLDKYHNMLLLDAFTKRYAMAGLRLGYGVSKNHALMEKLADAGPCWNVSAAAQAAGLAALECGEYEQQAKALLSSERSFLTGALKELGLKVYPSQANYLLFSCEKELKEPLMSKGMLIRSCENFEGLDRRYYRVCIMKHQYNCELVAALREVLNG